jgi:adenylate kinase
MDRVSILGAVLAASFAAFAWAQPGPIVLFIGPPASGKTTQAKQAAGALQMTLITAEDLVAKNPEEIKKITRSGVSKVEPVNDPIMNRLFEARIKGMDLSRGAVLDGYPATMHHADFLEKLAAAGKVGKGIVIHLDVPEAESRKRMAASGVSKDEMDQRLRDYEREMGMVRLYFPKADIVTLDSTKKPEEVRNAIASEIKKRLGR